MALPRTRYRLGRRLKSSAKARLDYITYLNSDGMPTRQAEPIDPDAPVIRRLGARFGLGGLMQAVVRVDQFLAIAASLGGEFRANIFPPVTIKPTFDLGGAMRAAIGPIPKQLAARFGGGGEMVANIAGLAQVQLAVTFSGGGAMQAQLGPVELGATFDGGGSFGVSGALLQRVRSSFALGGSFVTNLMSTVALSVDFAGGGDMEAGVAEPPPPAEPQFIGASAAQYSANGFNLTTHADTEAGDILVLVQASGGNDPALISGWTNISTIITVGTEPLGTGVRTSRKLATGPSETITIPDSGGHNAAVCLTFRGYDVVSFRSSASSAANGVSITATGSEAQTLADILMFVYAGRNAISSPNVSASANWLDETVVAEVSNSISLFVAVAKPAVTTAITFLTGNWTNNMANRVAIVNRLRP